MKWNNGKLEYGAITSHLGKPCVIRAAKLRVTCAGEEIAVPIHGAGTCSFGTQRGKNYDVRVLD